MASSNLMYASLASCGTQPPVAEVRSKRHFPLRSSVFMFCIRRCRARTSGGRSCAIMARFLRTRKRFCATRAARSSSSSIILMTRGTTFSLESLSGSRGPRAARRCEMLKTFSSIPKFIVGSPRFTTVSSATSTYLAAEAWRSISLTSIFVASSRRLGLELDVFSQSVTSVEQALSISLIVQPDVSQSMSSIAAVSLSSLSVSLSASRPPPSSSSSSLMPSSSPTLPRTALSKPTSELRTSASAF